MTACIATGCHDRPVYQLVSRSKTSGRVLDIDGPLCLPHGLDLADRAHAAGSIARVDLEPIPTTSQEDMR